MGALHWWTQTFVSSCPQSLSPGYPLCSLSHPPLLHYSLPIFSTQQYFWPLLHWYICCTAGHPGHIVVLQLCRAILYCTYCISPALLHNATGQRRQGFVVFALICPKIPFTVCSCASAASPHYRQMVGELIVTIASED